MNVRWMPAVELFGQLFSSVFDGLVGVGAQHCHLSFPTDALSCVNSDESNWESVLNMIKGLASLQGCFPVLISPVSRVFHWPLPQFKARRRQSSVCNVKKRWNNLIFIHEKNPHYSLFSSCYHRDQICTARRTCWHSSPFVQVSYWSIDDYFFWFI